MDFKEDDDRGGRYLLLLKFVVGLVVVGVLIGLGLGYVGSSTLMAGLDDSSPPPEAVPSGRTVQTPEGPIESASTEPTEEPTDEPTRDPRPEATLEASPNPASAGAEITLSGTVRGETSGTLSVQRKVDGSWVDFPEPGSAVEAAIGSDGTFSTFVITSQTGEAAWRLIDPSSDLVTPTVTIEIT